MPGEEDSSYFSLDEEGRTTSDKVFCIISSSNCFLCPQLDMTRDSVEEKGSQGDQGALTQVVPKWPGIVFGFSRVLPHSYGGSSGGIGTEGSTSKG